MVEIFIILINFWWLINVCQLEQDLSCGENNNKLTVLWDCFEMNLFIVGFKPGNQL